MRAGPASDAAAFQDVRTQLVLNCCKWDPQVGDVSTLAEFPVLITPQTWRFLASSAEKLTRETLAMEEALLLTAWKRFLPETRDPRDVPWKRDESWLVKPAFCNTGDSVTARDIVPPNCWRRACIDVLLHPRQWIAQRRFNVLPIDTPRGMLFACIGVYTIDGVACGAYGRLSPNGIINYAAVDAAVLIERDSRAGGDR